MARKNKTQISSRQWKLYEYLQQCFKENSNRWVSPEEICNQINEYEYDINQYDHCKAIRNDKKYLNSLDEVDQLIVMKDRCFKIATKEEAQEEISAHRRRLIAQAIEIANFQRKYKLDGQFKLLDNRGNEITEDSFVKPFRETFAQ